MQQAPDWYRDAVRTMFSAYPARRKSEQEVEDYAMHICSIPREKLGAAVMRVSEFHPLFPPTASELKTLVVKIDREKRESQSSSEASPHMGEPKHLATDNPFEQMAQTFERRIATGTFDAKQAAKELAALIDGHPIARSIDGDRIDYKLRAAGERDERDE